MLSNEPAAVDILRIAERRAHRRFHCTSLVFVQRDNFNGGLVFNINEDGMALSAANVLFEDQCIDLRVESPASGESIELNAHIAWKSKSKKEAGLRFVGLTAEAREQVRTWIALEKTSNELDRETVPQEPAQKTSETESQLQTHNRQTLLETRTAQVGGAEDWIFPESREETLPQVPTTPAVSKQDAHQRIRTWIFPEGARSGPPPQEAVSGESHPESSPKEREKSSDERPIDPTIAKIQQTRAIGFSAESARTRRELNRPVVEQIAAEAPRAHADRISAEATPGVSDRRSYARVRIIPLGYVRLGETNGGISLNISEGGVAITAGESLAFDRLPSLHIQFPDSDRWIETSGQIVWRSESKKEAGVRFVGLTEEARRQITTWISEQASAARVQEQDATMPDTQDEHAPFPSRFEAAGLPPELHDSATFPAQHTETRVTLPRTLAPSRKPPIRKPFRRRFMPARVPRVTDVRRSARRVFATLVVFASLLFAAHQWFMPRGVLRNAAAEMRVAIRQTAKPLGKNPQSEPSPRVNTTPNVDDSRAAELHRPAQATEPSRADAPTVAANSMQELERQARLKARRFTSAALEPPKRPVANRLDPGKSKEQRWVTASDVNIRPFGRTRADPHDALPTPPQLDAQTIQPANLVPPSASRAQPAKPKDHVSSLPSAARPSIPVNAVATVAVLADPYLSLRDSAERRLKKRREGASLQLGHLISRVEPVYPDEAKRQGIQGTVKLHAVVGRNGSVEALVLLNGSPALAPAALNAVRQWRYSETRVAGRSVETEEDIAVVFRLSNPPAPER